MKSQEIWTQSTLVAIEIQRQRRVVTRTEHLGWSEDARKSKKPMDDDDDSDVWKEGTRIASRRLSSLKHIYDSTFFELRWNPQFFFLYGYHCPRPPHVVRTQRIRSIFSVLYYYSAAWRDACTRTVRNGNATGTTTPPPTLTQDTVMIISVLERELLIRCN